MNWSAVIYCDGQPVTGEVPCDDYDAAGIAAPFFAAWLGGAVSVGAAVSANRPRVRPEPSLFDELAAS